MCMMLYVFVYDLGVYIDTYCNTVFVRVCVCVCVCVILKKPTGVDTWGPLPCGGPMFISLSI